MDELNYLRNRMAYFTECQLATAEWFARRKYPILEKARHKQIAEMMVEVCHSYKVDTSMLPRLKERLSQGKKEEVK